MRRMSRTLQLTGQGLQLGLGIQRGLLCLITVSDPPSQMGGSRRSPGGGTTRTCSPRQTHRRGALIAASSDSETAGFPAVRKWAPRSLWGVHGLAATSRDAVTQIGGSPVS